MDYTPIVNYTIQETTTYYFGSAGNEQEFLWKDRRVIFITDDNIYELYTSFFEQKETIVFPAGEDSKTWKTVKKIIAKLISLEVDKGYCLIGVGGGVVSDVVGFVASIYMRGLQVGFIPTSLLAMVDAAIGGKNGVNVNVYKNIIGTIRQPDFVYYDLDFLKTLPNEEWSNGFAEIIKYGCIFDETILRELSTHHLDFYKKNSEAPNRLIYQCASLKIKTVQEDAREKGIRKLLNFGHTVGHAIENLYGLSHGNAVAIGMMIAAQFSVRYMGLSSDAITLLKTLLGKYQLPSAFSYQTKDVMQVLKLDKKRTNNEIDFIVLKELGDAEIRKTGFDEIENILNHILTI